jgi:protein-tyrosine-phosphatase
MALQWLENNGYKGWEVASAGTLAADGSPTSKGTVDALRNWGIEYSGSSAPITKELVDRATAVLCMTSSQCLEVASLTQQPNKIELLDLDGGIIDPVGCNQSVYDALAKRIAELIPLRLASIIKQYDNKE